MKPEYIELSNVEPGAPLDLSPAPLQASALSPLQVLHVLVRLGVISEGTPVLEASVPRLAAFMLDKVASMSVEGAMRVLRDALAEHNGDVNFPHADYLMIERLVLRPEDPPQTPRCPSATDLASSMPMTVPLGGAEKFASEAEWPEPEGPAGAAGAARRLGGDWHLQVRLEAALIAFHSPYPEIRAITDPYDDPTTPADTLRAYTVALVWTLIGSVINNFFVHRLPGIRLSLHTVQLLLYPTGKLCERLVPPNFRLGGANLNPGPWSYKEMMLSTIIYLGALGTPYLVYNIVVMKLDRFYGLKWVTPTFQVLLALLTQCLGFGFAGIMRKVCIYPAKAMWPTILPTIALNRALMHDEPRDAPAIHGWRILRYAFFFAVFAALFAYNVVPLVLFKLLLTFNWPTWFAPELVALANVAGSVSGLGLNPLPLLDWNILDAGACLTIPFYTYANQYLGLLLAFGVILAVYYTNTSWTGYLKINSNQLFNNRGTVFSVHDLMDADNRFDQRRYDEVGPPYFLAANLVLYGAYFCLYPFAILYHMATEWLLMKSAFVNTWLLLRAGSAAGSAAGSVFGRDRDDPHCRMMAHYPETPNWWFMAVLGCSVVCALLCVTLYPAETPVWGIFFTIAINLAFLIPITTIALVTGFTFGLNVLVELIVGYAIPNSGLALLTLKAFGYNIDLQALNYITDQKLAHYTKLPPRAIFKGQLLATLLNVFVALVVTNWQIANVENFCDPHQKDKFSCPGDTTYFFLSVQYGVIGPAKVFSGLYPVLKWCFLLGVVLVVPCALFKRHGPARLTRYFQPTLIIGGFLLYAPINLSYFTGGFYLSYLFMYRIRRRYLAWWEKYNYVLTSALSAGVAMSALLLYFTIQYHQISLDWWGNTISFRGVEGDHGVTTWLNVLSAPEGYFGLRKGHFP